MRLGKPTEVVLSETLGGVGNSGSGEYSTLLGSNLSLATRVRFLDGRGVTLDPLTGEPLPSAALSALPKFNSEIDLQYLDRKGFFTQVTQAYISSRQEVLNPGETVARRNGGFGLTGIRVGKRFGLKAAVFLEASNVFDKRYTVTTGSQITLQQGRRFTVGASLRF